MKNKLVGIGICMLLIAAVVLPVAGAMNKRENRKPLLFSKNTGIECAPGEFIVKLTNDATFSTPALTALNEKYQVYTLEKMFPNAEDTILDNTYILHVPLGTDIPSLVQEYTLCPDVVYAEPNGLVFSCSIPNDTNFSKQWYMHNIGQEFLPHVHGTPDADIDAPEAWDIGTGSPNVVIAIIDTGIDYTHPDLAAQMWNNTDEIPGNYVDDDGNGYIDDIRGWDFVYNDSDPKDEMGHGTMCAGIADASTNNGLGIAGVARNCKVMIVRALDETGWGLWSNISKAIRYAADNGANVISMSLGGYGYSTTLLYAVDYAYSKKVFLCAAAGNDNISAKLYPAAYDNATAVGATDKDDCRVTPYTCGWGSNYGDWVDIAAPGDLIYSTMPTYHVYFNEQGMGRNYEFGGGTSFATPMVAGVAALLLSQDPSLTPDEVKALLCGNVDPYKSTKYIGTGRLNAQKALSAVLVSDVKITIKGGFGVKMEMTNNGTSNVTQVNWQIHVDGGLYWMINKTKNGTITIPAGESKTVSTGLLFGLGSLNIRIRLSVIEKTAKGTQLFIFSMVKK